MFTIPNWNQATHVGQGRLMQSDVEAILRGLNGIGIYSGGVVTQDNAGPNMNVDITALHAAFSGLGVLSSAGTLALDASDPVNPRYDLISVSSSGVLAKTTGTAEANPTKPNWPAGDAALAEVYVAAGVSTIVDSAIIDKRVRGWWPQVIMADSDESVANDTLQNDDELFLTLGANEVYEIEGLLLFTSGTVSTSDVKHDWTLPVGATISWFVSEFQAAAVAITTVQNFGRYRTTTNFNGGVITTATIEASPIFIRGTIRNGSTPGVAQLRWAQNTLDAGNPTVREADSWLRAMPVTLP